MKEEITNYQNAIIKLNDYNVLTDVQTLILTDIFYFENFKGGYKYIKKFVFEKYKSYCTEKQIDVQINDLLKNFIIKKTKREIFNGKFITTTYFTLEDFLSSPEKVEEYFNDLVNANFFEEEIEFLDSIKKINEEQRINHKLNIHLNEN